MRMQKPLPVWLVVVVIIELLPMFLFPILLLSNPSAAPALTGGEGLALSTAIYSARNVAVGIALVIALWLRHPAMLFILILVRLVTDLIDYPALIFLGGAENVFLVTAIFVFLFYIPATIALRYLWRQMNENPVSAGTD
ncbi:MAG: hypothetical protein R3228_14870 [Halioglobus sp.]|nr:hypothetical protein [Halioglobus sp.]